MISYEYKKSSKTHFIRTSIHASFRSSQFVRSIKEEVQYIRSIPLPCLFLNYFPLLNFLFRGLTLKLSKGVSLNFIKW